MNICQSCKKEYSNKYNLLRHQEKPCKIKEIHKCKKCQRILSTKQRLLSHLDVCKEKLKEDIIDELKINEKQIIKDIQPLIINDYTLIYRTEDGYVDVTNLCKAGGKEFKHWNSLEKTQAFIKVLSRSVGIPTDLLIQYVTGGKNEDRKTWVHPQVAINIAQWISPEFDVQVSKWIFELMITGKVELHNEKSSEELKSQYEEQINKLTEDYKSLLHKHNSSMKNHRYVKFKKSDPCFYIIESGILCDCGQPNIQYKFGISGTENDTIDDRLRNHRTLWPLLKIKYILFMKDIVMIEKNFKIMYEKEINPNGHEIIEGITIGDMIHSIKKLLDLLNIKAYEIMMEDKLKEYNDYVDTTVKLNNV